MNIKKPYVEIVDFLKANENKKVSSILEEILLMAESKKTASTVLMDSEENVIAIFCWYHKQWEVVSDVPYGSKANTKTGLNTMCKVGVSKWTKQQRDAKEAKANILDGVANGDIDAADIKIKLAEVEDIRNTIDETDMPQGFANEADLIEYLNK